MEDTGKQGVFFLVVKSHFDVIQHRHLVEEPDVLESTGNARFADLHRGLAGQIDAV